MDLHFVGQNFSFYLFFYQQIKVQIMQLILDQKNKAMVKKKIN